MRRGKRMKPGQLLALVITVAVFLSTFFISQGLPTGFIVKGDSVVLRISDAEVSDTTARLSWKTQAEALSVLVVNDKSMAFETARQFSKEVAGLTPGTSYKYVIRACNENKCEEKSSEFTTRTSGAAENPASPITGAVIGVSTARAIKNSISYVLYALIGMAALIVVGRIGYEKIAESRDPMQGMVTDAKKLIENEKYEEAYEVYAKARQAYSQLEEEAKLKHYDSLISIYQNLKRYSELKEAQRLAEKYAQGTITREELRKLNEMLAS